MGYGAFWFTSMCSFLYGIRIKCDLPNPKHSRPDCVSFIYFVASAPSTLMAQSHGLCRAPIGRPQDLCDLPQAQSDPLLAD